MHECSCSNWLSQLLLPLFVMALLFGFAGIGPDIVIKGAVSVATAIVEGVFKVLQELLAALIKLKKDKG